MKTIGNIIHKINSPLDILDSKNRVIYHEDSTGYWEVYRYDYDDALDYFGDSYGVVDYYYYIDTGDNDP